ncbi:autophagy-related protein 16-1 isoform X2 [Denticeps clupeoides]|uniref:autophagy-related protein 16-1 isoform X2 n=1 Tax=Denticeps clupeoides TaxID=299321 RepID=UPI0010A45593|nr:autophagy-related protein 16-1-like isoform X2 [Denticeps clupeoides]
METWKSHVRAGLFNRDRLQKDPFAGVFSTLSKLEGRLELRDKLLENPPISGWSGPEDEKPIRLQLRLKECELDRFELSERVSDLTATLYLKEAELQYCHSQVVRFRGEAVALAREASSLRSGLAEYEYALELQSKQFAGLQIEMSTLRAELSVAWVEKEDLLERWMEEKRLEAERVNKHNAAQERWHRFAGCLNSHKHREAPRICGQTEGDK